MSSLYWASSRYNDECSECEAEIYAGDRIVIDPRDRKVYCESCGEEVMEPPKHGGAVGLDI